MTLLWLIPCLIAAAMIVFLGLLWQRVKHMEDRLTAFERFVGVDFHMEVARSVEQYREHKRTYERFPNTVERVESSQ